MMALDSASVRPSSNSTVGTWPALLSLRNCVVRVSRLSVSTSIHWYGRASLSHTHLTLRQLPELVSPYIFINAEPSGRGMASEQRLCLLSRQELRTGQNLYPSPARKLLP